MASKLRPLLWLLLACAGLYLAATFLGKPFLRPRPTIETASPATTPVPSPSLPPTPVPLAPSPAALPPAAPTVAVADSPTPTPSLAPVPLPIPAAVASKPGQVTVTYWNVEWFPGRKPKASEKAQQNHLAAVVPVLEKLDPDVLGLEEVADLPAAQSIAEHLKGFKVDVCSPFINERPDSGITKQQQVVLCSRLPVIQAWAEPWKKGEDGVLPTRGFAFAAYQPAPGKVLLVYGMHLKSNRTEPGTTDEGNTAQRQESARQLLAHQKAMTAAYSSMGKVTVVVGGDMNTSLDDPRFEQETTLRSLVADGFQWAWKDVPAAERMTLPGGGPYPSTCFDHIFYRGGDAKLLKIFVEQTTRASSDHKPVTASFEL